MAPWHPGDKGYDFEHKTIAGLRVFLVGSRQNILVLKVRENFTRTLVNKSSLPLFGNSVLLQVKTRSRTTGKLYKLSPKLVLKEK